jgi:hypothetical protein
MPYASFGVPIPERVFLFTVAAIVMAVYLVGPAAGAWLLGLRARTRRRLARQLKPVNT